MQESQTTEPTVPNQPFTVVPYKNGNVRITLQDEQSPYSSQSILCNLATLKEDLAICAGRNLCSVDFHWNVLHKDIRFSWDRTHLRISNPPSGELTLTKELFTELWPLLQQLE